MSETIETNSEKQKKGPLFWVIVSLVIVLLLGLCCCGGSILTFSTFLDEPEFQENFLEGYCSTLEEGGSLDNDVFGWCD